MKTYPKLALAGALLLLAGFVGGCINLSGAQVARDVEARRQQRFQNWRAEHTGEAGRMQTLSGPLALNDALRIALQNSREVQIARLEKGKADARELEAWSEALPTVELNAGYTRLDEVPSISVGPETVTLGDKNNYSVGGTVRQPLFKGGAIGAGIRGAQVYRVYTDEQLRGTYQRVVYNVRKAYYDVCLARELQIASAESVKVARSFLADVEKNLKAGTASEFDRLRAEVEVKNLLALNVQDQNRYNLSLTTLYNLIGVSQESAVELTDGLTPVPLAPDMEESVKLAYTQHTDLLQSEYLVRLQAEALSYAQGGYWPEVNANWTLNYAKPDPHDQTRIAWGTQWQAGLTATYRLFEGFKTVAKVRQARLDVRKSEVALADAEQRVLLDVRQSILSLQDATQFVASQQASVDQAQAALRLADLGFKEGTRKEIEVADARRSLAITQANRAQALYDLEIARLQYERATGTIPVSIAPAIND